MLYRVHQRLLIDSQEGRFIEGGEGCTHTLSTLNTNAIKALLKMGAISEVQAPPLETFTGWAGRAKKLGELGIDTIGFITTPAHDIAFAIRANVRKEEEDQETFDVKVDKLTLAVERWQREIKTVLDIGDARTRR
jgi:hypothetical protein